jgi:hypothetical protein
MQADFCGLSCCDMGETAVFCQTGRSLIVLFKHIKMNRLKQIYYLAL